MAKSIDPQTGKQYYYGPSVYSRAIVGLPVDVRTKRGTQGVGIVRGRQEAGPYVDLLVNVDGVEAWVGAEDCVAVDPDECQALCPCPKHLDYSHMREA